MYLGADAASLRRDAWIAKFSSDIKSAQSKDANAVPFGAIFDADSKIKLPSSPARVGELVIVNLGGSVESGGQQIEFSSPEYVNTAKTGRYLADIRNGIYTPIDLGEDGSFDLLGLGLKIRVVSHNHWDGGQRDSDMFISVQQSHSSNQAVALAFARDSFGRQHEQGKSLDPQATRYSLYLNSAATEILLVKTGLFIVPTDPAVKPSFFGWERDGVNFVPPLNPQTDSFDPKPSLAYEVNWVLGNQYRLEERHSISLIPISRK